MDSYVENNSPPRSPIKLPPDLPRSLDDRRTAPMIGGETEIYDAWQGQSQLLTTPMPAQPLKFNLSFDDHDYGEQDTGYSETDDSDSRLVRMLASQARLRGGGWNQGEEAVMASAEMSESEKRRTLQDQLAMAASNGEVDRIKKLLDGPAKEYVDVNVPDADGNVPLIYASCFGHLEAAMILTEHGADIDRRDHASWSPLMWAITNRHKEIVKHLLDHGASPEVKTTSGRTPFDFVAPNSEMFDYLQESGYNIGNAGVSDDFYNAGFSQDKFEEEMAENELRRRMMMESAINLEVDLGSLTLDDQPESPGEMEEGQEFVWDRCLHDQMFVFQEANLEKILDVVVTNMTPTRSPSQKPVPANLLFLAARYAHYHASPELLEILLSMAMAKINDVAEKHQWDMTMLAFWISNVTLLLHYLKKDAGLADSTVKYQLALAELINEIFILIIRDAERRMDKILDKAMLDYESIPGFEDVAFQNEWKIFRSKPKPKAAESLEKRFRPPSPKRKAQTSPRNITSLLSSTLFVLELYDIHSVIITQLLSQLLYWLGAELFNRILNSRKYLARTKAMQIRMNVSTLEDWARVNNRQPGHYENGSTTSSGENTVDASRRHIEPVLQLLQWLQCSSSLGEDFEAVVSTIQQLPRLNPQQLIHSVKYYRAEVGEKTLPKSTMKYLQNLQHETTERRAREKAVKRNSHNPTPSGEMTSIPSTPTKGDSSKDILQSSPALVPPSPSSGHGDEEDAPDNLFMDPSLMLPFSLPSATDLLVSYGAGFGGLNRERERKYIPTVPPEFLTKLDNNHGEKKGSVYENHQWEGDE